MRCPVLPSSVAEVGRTYGDLVDEMVTEALALLDQAIRRGRSSPEAWRDAVQSIGDRLLLMQVTVASYADPFLNDVLEAQDADPTSEALVQAASFADLADGGGSWLQSLVYAPNSVRVPGQDWSSRFGFVASSIVKTGLTDTGRSSVQSGMQARPSCRYYVRMLNGKSCARCAILAGRKYRSSVAFKRHRRCDCRNIPGPEAVDDWTVDQKVYFRSLTADEQDNRFGKAGAEAIRLGADMAQVVNAESGVYVARAYDQDVLATTTGTTARGLAGQRLAGAGLPRLMPDEIFLQAERLGWDREEILRQLRRFAYVL
jgi:hypothetical protein